MRRFFFNFLRLIIELNFSIFHPLLLAKIVFMIGLLNLRRRLLGFTGCGFEFGSPLRNRFVY
jgi:hypothetical protein